MAEISRVLFTAKQAILTNLTAINVIGSNISNVNTPGYTRLRPIFESTGTKSSSAIEEQVGVKIAAIEQVYDRFLEYQLVQQQSTISNYTAQQDYLQRVENVLNENNGGGINDTLNEFLNAWGNLSVDPSSKSKRDMVISTAQNLAYVFNQRANELIDIQTAADGSVADNISLLNGYLNQMADLNQIIVTAETSGASASSIKDQRNELLKEISSLIDINYMERSDGSLYITLPENGKALVEGFNSWELQAKRNPDNNNLYDIVFAEDPSTSINNQISGGKLAGILAVRDTKIPLYLDQLNQTASSIVNKVNELHVSGYDQDGNPGEIFFNSTTEARYMQVNDAIVADTRKIAASATVNADGNNAAAITAIQDDQMYASLGTVMTVVGTGTATGQINNVGQIYKNTTSNIIISRGATSGSWTVYNNNNGGYSNLSVLTSSDTKITLDFNGDSTADLTLNLSGTWANGDRISFALSKNDNTSSIDGYFNAMIANMGQDVVNANQTLERETTIFNQQNDQREQLSGVSIDEEMINLIKYQMAYGAAGRMTQTVSEMMDVIINLGR